jgi:FkbM family methyltransferase
MKTRLKKLLAGAGLQIQRLPRTKVDEPADGHVSALLNFGPYKIRCHCKEHIEIYSQAPNYNQFLGRLAACLGEVDAKTGIIDVGANCGDTAALMRSHTHLPILCIEGDANLFSLLKENSRQCPDVTLINSYLGEKTGPASVKIEKEGWNNTLVPSENSDSLIRIVRLDELQHAWLTEKKVGLLKVDTEGFDVPILFGAKGILEQSKPVVAFEYNRDNMDAISEPGLRIFPYLESLGYEGLMTYDNYGRYFMATTVTNIGLLTDLDRYTRRPKRGVFYFDVVAFPKRESVLFRRFRDAEMACEYDTK